MATVIDGVLTPLDKAEIESKLKGLFDAVFERGPLSGQFNFKRESGWQAYHNALREQKILRGVWICRAINSGITWFPIYHFVDEDSNEYKIRIPDGAVKYSYIEKV